MTSQMTNLDTTLLDGQREIFGLDFYPFQLHPRVPLSPETVDFQTEFLQHPLTEKKSAENVVFFDFMIFLP